MTAPSTIVNDNASCCSGRSSVGSSSPRGKRSFRKWLSAQRQRKSTNKSTKSIDTSDEISLATTVTSSVATSACTRKAPIHHEQPSPQDHLNAILNSRGRSTRTYPALESAYFNKPTQLQLASYNGNLVKLVRQGDVNAFRALLASGISTNPCDFSGESLLHMLCRSGEVELLQVMLEEHQDTVTVQTCDDYGRTPLSSACWNKKPSFETIRMLLDRDINLLFLKDVRGATPLSYVPQEQWSAWIEFLNKNADRYWSDKSTCFSLEQVQDDVPALTLQAPNSRKHPNPARALTLEMAALVASGKMKPEEADCLRYTTADADQLDESTHSHLNSSSHHLEQPSTTWLNDDCLDDDASDFSWDHDDMAELLEGLSM